MVRLSLIVNVPLRVGGVLPPIAKDISNLDCCNCNDEFTINRMVRLSLIENVPLRVGGFLPPIAKDISNLNYSDCNVKWFIRWKDYNNRY